MSSRQVWSLDDDRLVLAADLRVAITRVGLFKLSFALPEGLEVEALSGAALSQWTEAQEGGRRIVTLHLNGRTLGEQAFNLSLAGPAPRAQEAWPLPRLVVREATRQTGEALIVPEKGYGCARLRASGQRSLIPAKWADSSRAPSRSGCCRSSGAAAGHRGAGTVGDRAGPAGGHSPRGPDPHPDRAAL